MLSFAAMVVLARMASLLLFGPPTGCVHGEAAFCTSLVGLVATALAFGADEVLMYLGTVAGFVLGAIYVHCDFFDRRR